MQIDRIDLNPLGGIAGDMFAAALFDAFPGQYTAFQNDLALLGVKGLAADLQDRQSKGMRAGHFSVTQDTQSKPPRTLRAVQEFLGNTPLAPEVIETACAIYKLLAGAEAAVHGKTLETIHFHEVSDWDSMVDILAAAGLIARLNCRQWRIGPLPLGGGTINTAHGSIMLPAPATTELLAGFEWIDDGVSGERVTPTGAAIVAFLKPVSLQSAAPAATQLCSGSGCGTRELADRANVLRATAYTRVGGDNLQQDQVLQLAFEIDDMTGEELANALDRLRRNDGVLDVCSVAVMAKKSRMATGVRILAAAHAGPEIIKQCFIESSTLGVRYQRLDRFLVRRDIDNIDGLPVKLAHRPDNRLTAKAESDHLADTALPERRERAAHAEQLALKSQQARHDD